ncbi:MAG: alanine racemase C-terminal domain-containing protein [Methylococcales bacterium]
MDMLTLDLTACPTAHEGDEVILWGEQLAVEILAKSSATIAYTLLCGITRRVGIVDVARASENIKTHPNLVV